MGKIDGGFYNIDLKGSVIEQSLIKVSKGELLPVKDGSAENLLISVMKDDSKAATNKEYVDNTISNYTKLNDRTLTVNNTSIKIVSDSLYAATGGILFANSANMPEQLRIGTEGQILRVGALSRPI